eukprot:1672192-Rhodomonas_salina.1
MNEGEGSEGGCEKQVGAQMGGGVGGREIAEEGLSSVESGIGGRASIIWGKRRGCWGKRGGILGESGEDPRRKERGSSGERRGGSSGERGDCNRGKERIVRGKRRLQSGGKGGGDKSCRRASNCVTSSSSIICHAARALAGDSDTCCRQTQTSTRHAQRH